MSAIRIDVSWRQSHFSQSASPSAPPAGDGGFAAGRPSGSAAAESKGSVSGARTSVIGSPPHPPSR